jgi:hypothetical protein
MADQFDALVSGVSKDPEQQQAIIRALRNQSMMGQMYQTTGDRVIAPMGQQMTEEAGQQAHEIGQERQTQDRLSQTLALQSAAQAEEVRNHNLQNSRSLENNANNAAYRTTIADMNDQTRRDLAAEKLANAPKKPLPYAADKEMEQFRDSLDGVQKAKAAYQALADKGIDTGGFARSAKDMAAAKLSDTPILGSMVTNNQRAVQNVDALYGRAFTLPELKATIGVRHNEYMQKLFESYHIDPAMSNEQKLQNLGQIEAQLKQRLSNRAADYSSQKYDVGKYADFLPGSPSAAAPSAPSDTESKTTLGKGQPYLDAVKGGQNGGLAAPTSQLFPQSLAPPARSGNGLPYVPGMQPGNLFSGLPGMNPNG